MYSYCWQQWNSFCFVDAVLLKAKRFLMQGSLRLPLTPTGEMPYLQEMALGAIHGENMKCSKWEKG
jgi:hypothetical protein